METTEEAPEEADHSCSEEEEEEQPPSTSDCILALNNQAIEMVQEGDDRNAIKLLLEALSRLQTELAHPDNKSREEGVAGGQKDSAPAAAAAAAEEEKQAPVEASSTEDGQWFMSLPMTIPSTGDVSSNNGNEESKPEETPQAVQKKSTPMALLSQKIDMYDGLFDMHQPTFQPTRPEHRDGVTALLLYNMGAIHHRRGFLGVESSQQLLQSSGHLKKAAHTYSMARSALEHWKQQRSTPTPDGQPLWGYPLLACAILNNQWQIQSLLNTDPLPGSRKNETPPVVTAEHIAQCLRKMLPESTHRLPPDAYQFFSHNLQRHEAEGSKKRKAREE